jgi:hypothetical protein
MHWLASTYAKKEKEKRSVDGTHVDGAVLAVVVVA